MTCALLVAVTLLQYGPVQCHMSGRHDRSVSSKLAQAAPLNMPSCNKLQSMVQTAASVAESSATKHLLEPTRGVVRRVDGTARRVLRVVGVACGTAKGCNFASCCIVHDGIACSTMHAQARGQSEGCAA